MKKLVAIIVLSAIALVTLPSKRTAEAFPGMMCFSSGGCGRCEVCVKDTPTSPSGTCHVIQGCY
jgi:hypothetical protein